MDRLVVGAEVDLLAGTLEVVPAAVDLAQGPAAVAASGRRAAGGGSLGLGLPEQDLGPQVVGQDQVADDVGERGLDLRIERRRP